MALISHDEFKAIKIDPLMFDCPLGFTLTFGRFMIGNKTGAKRAQQLIEFSRDGAFECEALRMKGKWNLVKRSHEELIPKNGKWTKEQIEDGSFSYLELENASSNLVVKYQLFKDFYGSSNEATWSHYPNYLPISKSYKF